MTRTLALEDGTRAQVLRVCPASAELRPSDKQGRLILLLGGLGGDALATTGLYARLAAALSAHGAVLRLGFEQPVHSITQQVEAAVLATAQEAPGATVLVGHSAGGLVAPIAAAACQRAGVPIAGVLAVGTPGCRWAEALAVAAEDQLALRGLTGEQHAKESREARALYLAVLRAGKSRSQLAGPERAWLACLAASDLSEHRLHGVPLSYVRSLDAIDPARAFTLADCPTLQLVGEHDWIVGPRARPAGAILLPRCDHALATCDSAAESFAAFRAAQSLPTHEAALAKLASCVLELFERRS